MGYYEHTLRALLQLLEAVGETHWSASIREDIRLWQADFDTRHHLSIYGGMGTFNDVWICAANHYNVTDQQEPWVNALLEWLKSLSHHLAEHSREKVTAASLLEGIGRYDAVLAAFVGGDRAAASLRGRFGGERKLHGSRCFDCGYAEVSTRNIEMAIANDLIPIMVFHACEAKALDTLVDRVLSLKIPDADEVRHEVVSAVTASGINIVDREGWMRPCPLCNSVDTGAYRWRLASGPPERFIPTDDNLPVRM